jgi:sugar lactone lactonase YvrE
MADGRVLVCNADLGLQAVNPETQEVESLLPEVFGEPFGVCNNAAVASDGTIVFTESSRRYRLEKYKNDIVEDTQTGRLIRWHPDRGAPEVLLDGLAFANGVALSADEGTVFVAETGKGRIHKVSLDDGANGVFAEVPGYPDNLSRGSDGLIWAAIPAPLNATVQKLHTLPLWLRKFVVRLPDGMQPPIARSCRVMAFNEDGLVVHDLEGDPSQYHHVTGVREKDGIVWLGSIYEEALGTFALRG